MLIVAHQGILRIIYAYFMGVDREKAPFVKIPLNTVIKLVPAAYGCTENRICLIPGEVASSHQPSHWNIRGGHHGEKCTPALHHHEKSDLTEKRIIEKDQKMFNVKKQHNDDDCDDDGGGNDDGGGGNDDDGGGNNDDGRMNGHFISSNGSIADDLKVLNCMSDNGLDN